MARKCCGCVALILLMLIGGLSDAHALSARQLLRYKSTPAEYDEKAGTISTEKLTGPAALFHDPIGIAISDENEIAVWSGPAPDAAYSTAINVYDEHGNFLYGYQLKLRNTMGMKGIFFLEDSTLCLFSLYEQLLYTFTPEEGPRDIYIFPTMDDYLCLGSYLPVSHIVNIDPSASCSVVGYGNGRFKIRDSAGEVRTLYDNSALFAENVNRNKARMFVRIIVGAGCMAVFALCLIWYRKVHFGET